LTKDSNAIEHEHMHKDLQIKQLSVYVVMLLVKSMYNCLSNSILCLKTQLQIYQSWKTKYFWILLLNIQSI